MLLSALRVHGFAAVEDGNFVKIVPEAEAKTSASPTGDAAARGPGDVRFYAPIPIFSVGCTVAVMAVQ